MLQFEPCTLSATGLPVSIPAAVRQPVGARGSRAARRAAGSSSRSRSCPAARSSRSPIRCSCSPADPASRRASRSRPPPGRSASCCAIATSCSSTSAARAAPIRSPAAPRRAISGRCGGDRSRGRAPLRRASACESLDADPRFYTTSDAVLDLEEVRAAIGAEQVNLVGISYGTRVALEYLRRYPAARAQRGARRRGAAGARARRRSTRATSRPRSTRSSALCERDADVRAALRRRRARRCAKLLEAPRQAPQPVRYRDPLTHESPGRTLTRDVVAGVVRLFAYVPQLSAMLPQIAGRGRGRAPRGADGAGAG